MASVYFETSWAILSTIGLANVLFGFIVSGITAFSPVSLIPIIVSAAGAVANGLCYYSFYADYPLLNTAISSAFADVMWMIQEAGISFYSYAILVRVLRNKDRVAFMSLFWLVIVAIFVLRLCILVARVKILVSGEPELKRIINGLHVGYFTSMALLECLGAFFLLRKFSAAKTSSLQASIAPTLFQHLMRSTEIRLAVLALIGVTRAVAYFFQPSMQKAETVASQIDRFVYTLECMFPVMIFIDILASRLVFEQSSHDNSSFQLPTRWQPKYERPRSDRHSMAPTWNPSQRVRSHSRRGSGTSHSSLFRGPSEYTGEAIHVENSGNGVNAMQNTLPLGITKTVEIKIEKVSRKQAV